MTEGKGYCARRQEYRSQKKLAELLRNKDKTIIIPDSSKPKRGVFRRKKS